MKKPKTLKEANKLIKKLIDELVSARVDIQVEKTPYICCPYKVVEDSYLVEQESGNDECRHDCEACREEFWETYEKILYKEYEFEK